MQGLLTILGKKDKKMASPMGFDKEGASPTKSRSKATATLRKVSNPIFCAAKNNGKKKKQQRANLFAKLLLAFCRDYSRFLEKKTKKWHLQWDSNPENTAENARCYIQYYILNFLAMREIVTTSFA